MSAHIQYRENMRAASNLSFLLLTVLKADAVAPNETFSNVRETLAYVAPTESPSSSIVSKGGNVLREAIQFLQLEAISNLKEEVSNLDIKCEKAEKQIQDQKEEIMRITQESEEKVRRIAQEKEEQVQRVIQENEEKARMIRDENREEIIRIKQKNEAVVINITNVMEHQEEEIVRIRTENDANLLNVTKQYEEKIKIQNENTMKKETLLKNQIHGKEILVSYVISFLDKGEEMMQSRQDIIDDQAKFINGNDKKYEECSRIKNELQKSLSESHETIQTQARQSARLELIVKNNRNITRAYDSMSQNELSKNNCDSPAWVSSLTDALSAQKENIDLLTSHLEDNAKLEDYLNKLQHGISRIDVPEHSDNSTLIRHYYRLLQQQSASISMFRNMMTNKVNKTCGLKYNKEESGLLISASTCQCLPVPTNTSGLELTNVRFDCTKGSSYHIDCAEGRCETTDWPDCEDNDPEEMEDDENLAWEFFQCQDVDISYLNQTVSCGVGGWKVGIWESKVGQGVLKSARKVPCLDCDADMFQWSSWSRVNDKKTRVRGNNNIIKDSFQKETVFVELELRGGNGHSTGNVFVLNIQGRYGPVCDDEWDNTDATVVCKQLGFTTGVATVGSYFGNVPSVFAMDDVDCYGDENPIQLCNHKTSEDCDGGEGAGVKCS